MKMGATVPAMSGEPEIVEEASPFVLIAQIAELKYRNSLLSYENDGLKNELRNKESEIKDLQIKIHQQQHNQHICCESIRNMDK